MSVDTARPAALAGCIEACARCADVAEAVGATDYGRSPAGRSSIGGHVRHALEHVQCLLDGLEGGLIDYDARARDQRLERDPVFVRRTATALRDRLLALGHEQLQAALTVRDSAAPQAPPCEMASTLGRELAFLSGHTLHHLEIAGLLAALLGIEVPGEWSLAYSTAAWRQRAAADAGG